MARARRFFSRAYFPFDSFEFIKPRRHGMLVGFLRLWVGGCEGSVEKVGVGRPSEALP